MTKQKNKKTKKTVNQKNKLEKENEFYTSNRNE